MSNGPRVSVLTTVYNGAEFLRVAIDSVLAQSYTDWELVLVDDGSTDDSPAILASYGDPRIRVVILPQNVGRLHAVRRAFELARGEYVAMLDADDVARTDRLERQVAFLDANADVLVVGSWSRLIDETGRVLRTWHPPTDPQELHEFFGWGNPMVHSSVMYRAAAARAEGGYPTSMRYAHDCALWMRFAARGKVAIVPEELCDQRTVATSMTRGPRFRADVASDGLLLVQEARRLLHLRGQAATRNRDAYQLAEIKWGLYLATSGRRMAGVATIARAIARHPLGLVRSRSYRLRYFVQP